MPTIEASEIMTILPHRYPFLMVDRIIEIAEDGKSGVGIKCVTANEPQFTGHFPAYPILPGVLVIEALAQCAGVLLLRLPEFKDRFGFLVGVNEYRIRRQVKPGDTLRLEVNLTRVRSRLVTVQGKASVDGQPVAEGEIMLAFGDEAGAVRP